MTQPPLMMAPGQLSPDGNYYWDGQAWKPSMSPDGHYRWDGALWVVVGAPPMARAVSRSRPRLFRGVLRWGLTTTGALLSLGLLGIGIGGTALSHPADSVKISGSLRTFNEHCSDPSGGRFQCAYVVGDQFCYRLHPKDFTPALPSLSARVGQPIEMLVDRENYETSRSVPDPFCNFEVMQVRLPDVASGSNVFRTDAMTQREYVGHSVQSFIVGTLVPGAVIGLLVVGGNIGYAFRGRSRRAE